MRSLCVAIVLLCMSCASAPSSPRSETASAPGSPAQMFCERDGWGCVRCTAMNVGEAFEPQWTAYVGGEPKAHIRGWSVLLPVGSEWTLIEMRVTNGAATAALYVWAQRDSPTSPPRWALYKHGEIAPGVMP